jgi:TPR repeat protein
VEQDLSKAFSWFRQAAKQGDADAQAKVAFMYANGQGTPPDISEAYFWFSLADARLPPGRSQERAAIQRNIGTLAPRMTQAEITEAKRRVGEWRPVAGAKQ